MSYFISFVSVAFGIFSLIARFESGYENVVKGKVVTIEGNTLYLTDVTIDNVDINFVPKPGDILLVRKNKSFIHAMKERE